MVLFYTTDVEYIYIYFTNGNCRLNGRIYDIYKDIHTRQKFTASTHIEGWKDRPCTIESSLITTRNEFLNNSLGGVQRVLNLPFPIFTTVNGQPDACKFYG